MCCKIISREPKFNFTCVTTKLCPRAVVSSVNGLTWSPLSSLSVIMPFPRTTNTSSICVLNARYPQRLTSSFRSKPKSLQRNNYFGYDHWSYFDIIGTHIFGTAVLNDQKSPSFFISGWWFDVQHAAEVIKHHYGKCTLHKIRLRTDEKSDIILSFLWELNVIRKRIHLMWSFRFGS